MKVQRSLPVYQATAQAVATPSQTSTNARLVAARGTGRYAGRRCLFLCSWYLPLVACRLDSGGGIYRRPKTATSNSHPKGWGR